MSITNISIRAKDFETLLLLPGLSPGRCMVFQPLSKRMPRASTLPTRRTSLKCCRRCI